MWLSVTLLPHASTAHLPHARRYHSRGRGTKSQLNSSKVGEDPTSPYPLFFEPVNEATYCPLTQEGIRITHWAVGEEEIFRNINTYLISLCAIFLPTQSGTQETIKCLQKRL